MEKAAYKAPDIPDLDVKSKSASMSQVNTPFGDVFFELENLLSFPTGILGFPEVNTFILSNIPQEKLKNFLLLQPVPEMTHTFIVLPLNKKGGKISEEALRKAAAQYMFSFDDLLVLGLATFNKTEDRFQATINLQAPILIDLSTHQGMQHVFDREDYDMHFKVMDAPLGKKAS